MSSASAESRYFRYKLPVTRACRRQLVASVMPVMLVPMLLRLDVYAGMHHQAHWA